MNKIDEDGQRDPKQNGLLTSREVRSLVGWCNILLTRPSRLADAILARNKSMPKWMGNQMAHQVGDTLQKYLPRLFLQVPVGSVILMMACAFMAENSELCRLFFLLVLGGMVSYILIVSFILMMMMLSEARSKLIKTRHALPFHIRPSLSGHALLDDVMGMMSTNEFQAVEVLKDAGLSLDDMSRLNFISRRLVELSSIGQDEYVWRNVEHGLSDKAEALVSKAHDALSKEFASVAGPCQKALPGHVKDMFNRDIHDDMQWALK